MTWWYIPTSFVLAAVLSHVIKEIIHIRQTGRFSLYTLLMETGGMPSGHASSVSALTVAILIDQGFTPLFWVSLLFSLVVIRDAFGVRKSVSDQAEVVNLLSSKAKLETKVRVVLGHTPFQVFVGIMLGCLVAATLSFFV